MKSFIHFIALALFLGSLGDSAFAQKKAYLCKDGSYVTVDIKNGLEIDLTEGLDSVTFSKPQMGNDVVIVYNGTTASVTIPEQLKGTVACSSGTSSDVVLTNTNTTDEVFYHVSGTSTAGSLTINADYKMTVKLNGVSLTSTKGSAIDLACGKRIDVVLGEGTTNSLADLAGGSQKACFNTKGHVELSGAGTLNVTGNGNHAIRTKEYLEVKKDVKAINIVKAANDAIHVGQYFEMNGGTLTIDKNTVNDGIQVEYETDDNDKVVVDEDNTGGIIVKGGTIDITLANAEDAKGMKADGDITISGGTFTIKAQSNGSRGIQTDGNITISEADNATTMTIEATGGKCTVAADSDDPHKCWGMKIDGDMTVNAGTITVTKNGSTAKKGIKVGGTYKKNGGTVSATIDNE